MRARAWWLTRIPAAAEYCNIMHADGAGTKSSLAYMYWKETGDVSVWRGIAQVYMFINNTYIKSSTTRALVYGCTLRLMYNYLYLPCEDSCVINK